MHGDGHGLGQADSAPLGFFSAYQPIKDYRWEPPAQRSPVWIGQRASADPAARQASAATLLKAVDGLISRNEAAYQKAGVVGAKPPARLAEAKGRFTHYSRAPEPGAWTCGRLQ